MTPTPAVTIEHLTHRYGDRIALDDLCLTVQPGEIFGLLGPNGSGKSTLFRILSTLMPAHPAPPKTGQVQFRTAAGPPATGPIPASGSSATPDTQAVTSASATPGTDQAPLTRIQILGHTLPQDQAIIRRKIGVLFQSASIDLRLTAAENLRHHGHLYGLSGSTLKHRIAELLDQVGLADRAGELAGKLSGGQRRRIELAACLLPQPQLLILDEPSTGLDPAARIDLWNLFRQTRDQGITLLLTTHLMDEAEHCDRLGFLDHGKLIATGTPAALKDTVGGNIVTLITADPQATLETIQSRFGITAAIVENSVRFEKADAHLFIPQLMEALAGTVSSVSVSKPTLEDVFRKVKRD